MIDQLFDTEPVQGEQWAKPNGHPLTIDKVWAHDLHGGKVWVSASQRGGDWYTRSGPLDKFLEHGYRRTK
jgi:hypothetical protein